MNDKLPALTGYNQQQANKIRMAYIRYLNTQGFLQQPLSRLDFGIHINLIEKQAHRVLYTAEKYAIEDMLYNLYTEPAVVRDRLCYVLKPVCTSYGVFALDMLTTTESWLTIKNRVQCFELLIRCVIYHFKKSEQFKSYLKSIEYRPRILDTNTVY